MNSAPLYLLGIIMLGNPCFSMNVTFTIEKEFLVSEEDRKTSFSEIKVFPKALFGALKWTYNKKVLYMAHCNSEEDCVAGIRMICKDKRCTCKLDDIFFEWPKYGCFSKAHMFGPCEVSGQCVAMNPNTYCNPDSGRCTCSPNYFYNGRECSIRYDTSSLKAQEVYKAAVVAAACFIVAVVGIFVACIVRRSFCRRDQHLQQGETNRDNDIFSISDEIAALRAVDKPPSYEEVLQIERTFYGIPPPEYSATSGVSSLGVFHPASNYCPVPADCLNPASNLEHSLLSAVNNQAGAEALSREYLKDLNQEAVVLDENSSGSNSLPAVPTNFLAAAEVIPPPSNVEAQNETRLQSLPSTSATHTQHIHSHYISSTPPPRLHQLYLKPSSSSSSLPGSPHLSSISSQIRVLNLPTPFQKELLNKKNSSSTSLNMPPHDFRDTQSVSLPRDSACSTAALDGRSSAAVASCNVHSSSSELAYDNFGFVSDLHV